MPKKLKATKIRAKKKTNTNVKKSEEVGKIMGMDGPVLMFPESDIKAILTQQQYSTLLSAYADSSLEDKTFYKRFKFSLDKNSKVLHAVSIQPCCSALCGSDNDKQYIGESDIKSFFKVKTMCKAWMNRYMVNDILVFRSTITQVWGAKNEIEPEVYTTPSFDILFKSTQAARKYMDMLKTFYKVRTSVDS